jgi:UDP-glucose 4-epimerase
LNKYNFDEPVIAVVSGGSGFIGGESVMALAEDENVREIRILDIAFPDYEIPAKARFFRTDVLDLARLIQVTKGANLWLDNVGLLGTDDKDELGAYRHSALATNVVGLMNQIQAAEINGVKNFFHQTKPVFTDNSENWYTITKKQAEIMMLWYINNSTATKFTMATYFNASGKRQHLGPVRKMFPLFVVSSILDIDIPVYGNGEQLVDIVHVRDLVDASILIATSQDLDVRGLVFDIGSAEPISVIHLAQKIISISKSGAKIKHYDMRSGEPKTSRVKSSTTHVSKLKDSLGWEPKKKIDDIVLEYLDFWLNYSNPIYIKNILLYFEKNGTPFTRDGKKILIEGISEKYISEKIEKARERFYRA